MLSRKHYTAIANILVNTLHDKDFNVSKNTDPYISALAVVSARLAKYFKDDNPNFNDKKWADEIKDIANSRNM